jgi:signal transduction histidine kinase
MNRYWTSETRSHRIASGLLWFALFGVFGASMLHASMRITDVQVDGEAQKIVPLTDMAGASNFKPLRLSSTAKKMIFSFADTNRSYRLRYKLEGYDKEWQELYTEMVVWIRLHDKDFSALAGNEKVLRGETPGWNGQPETAPMVEQSLSFVSPCAAKRMNAFFISNGGVASMGMMVVDDVTITIEKPLLKTNRVLTLDLSTGAALNTPLGTPSKWAREGPRPELARLLKRTDPSGKTVLYLHDTDAHKYGVWRTRDLQETISPGDRVTLNYRIAHSIGRGDKGEAIYATLPPGSYWFRVAQIDVNGLPTGKELSLPVLIIPPLYQRAEFWGMSIVTLLALLVLGLRVNRWHKMKQALKRSEAQRMLEAERARIARDIHDDLGATLAQIAMLSELAENELKQGKAVDTLLHDVFVRAHDTTRKLDEIVWALKPANDTLEHLVGYLCQFAETYLKLAALRFRLDAQDTLPQCILTSGQRHNLFLAAKEALHNVVKHAKATEVWLRIHVVDDVLVVSIEDNGAGRLPDSVVSSMHGSANMQSRMDQLGGTYLRTGCPGKGTVVEFRLPLKGQLSDRKEDNTH